MDDATQPNDLRLDGRYRLHEMLGRGGSGRVYRAVDERLDRVVAVKVFTHGARDDTERRRAEAETRLLAGLSHPHLVTVHDARLDADPPYLVMELVDGPTLAERIDSGEVDGELAVRVARGVADALMCVHESGVVHRDIKPSNILLRRDRDGRDEPVLADFGIAYSPEATRVTEPGLTIGTAAYLSPEQVRGLTPSPAGDIYSLGLVLIEAVTGRRAFPQLAPPASMIARVQGPPEITASVPPAWRELLERMTALDAQDRPGAAEVAAAIGSLERDIVPAQTTATATAPATLAVGASTEGGAHAERRATRAQPSMTRSRRRTALIAGGAVAAAVAVATVVWVNAPTGDTADAPTLPSLDEPLRSSMDDLLTAVSP